VNLSVVVAGSAGGEGINYRRRRSVARPRRVNQLVDVRYKAFLVVRRTDRRICKEQVANRIDCHATNAELAGGIGRSRCGLLEDLCRSRSAGVQTGGSALVDGADVAA